MISWIKVVTPKSPKTIYLIKNTWILYIPKDKAIEEMLKFGLDLADLISGGEIKGYLSLDEIIASENKQESDIIWHTENIGSFNKEGWTQDFSGWKIEGF